MSAQKISVKWTNREGKSERKWIEIACHFFFPIAKPLTRRNDVWESEHFILLYDAVFNNGSYILVDNRMMSQEVSLVKIAIITNWNYVNICQKLKKIFQLKKMCPSNILNWKFIFVGTVFHFMKQSIKNNIRSFFY